MTTKAPRRRAEKGLEVTGTLGVLSRAAQRRLLDLRAAFDRLKRTNFRYQQDLMDEFLAQMEGGPAV